VPLSPFIAPGTVSATPYNHYSSLASWETLFGLRRLSDAATIPATFGLDVFTGANRRRSQLGRNPGNTSSMAAPCPFSESSTRTVPL
jgi:hypothetical protein